MSNRKEELLAMLKSTLALSRSSLKSSMQEQAGNRNANESITKEKVPNITSNVDEEDEFLYGKSEAYDESKYSVTSQRFRGSVETSFDYNHGGSSNQRNTYDDEKANEHDFDTNIPKTQSGAVYDPYVNNERQYYNSQLKAERRIDSEPTYKFDNQSVYSTKIPDSSANRYEESIKQTKKTEQDRVDSNKLLDTILKTISMDENLSKIIVEKMKKPDVEPEKLNEAPKEEVEKPPTTNKMEQVETLEQPIQTIVNLSDRYIPMTSMLKEEDYEPGQPVYKHNMDRDIMYLSKNSSESNWNKKTEEFLKKLQSHNTNPKELICNSKDKSNSPLNRRKSSPSLRKSPKLTKKQKMSEVDSTGHDSKQKAAELKQHNIEQISASDQGNSNEPNPNEIIDTINAVEAELVKLEQRRQYLLSKPPNPDNENVLMINLKTQQEMKTQLALLKETFSQLENQKLRVNNNSQSNKTNTSHQTSSYDKGGSLKMDNRSKRRSRSRSRSRGYKRSKSRSPARYKRKYESRGHRKSPHDSHYRRSDRSRSRSRRGESRSSNDDSKSKTKNESKPLNLTKEKDHSVSPEKPLNPPPVKVDVNDKKDLNVPEDKKDETSGLKNISDQKDMLENVKFGIEFAIALFMKASQFFDGGNLWCQHCDIVFESISQFCNHLHNEEHLNKSGERNLNKPVILPRDQPGGPNSAPARGDEFIKPVQAFYCSLCKEYLEDNIKVKAHFTSSLHNAKFKEFLVKNNMYEVPYLARRMNALFKKEKILDISKSNPPNKSADPVVDIFEDKNVGNNKPNHPLPEKIENISITLKRRIGTNAAIPETKSIQVKPLQQPQMIKPKDNEQQKPMLLQPFKLNNMPKKNFPLKRN